MTAYDVFLSHATADKPEVETLARRLSEDGLKPFLDRWHLVPGKPWQEELEKALEASRSFAVLVGRDQGPWQTREMQAALERQSWDADFWVIPILLPGAPNLEDLPLFLKLNTVVDFRGGLDDEGAYRRLICGIRGIPPGDPGGATTGRPRGAGRAARRADQQPRVETRVWMRSSRWDEEQARRLRSQRSSGRGALRTSGADSGSERPPRPGGTTAYSSGFQPCASSDPSPDPSIRRSVPHRPTGRARASPTPRNPASDPS